MTEVDKIETREDFERVRLAWMRAGDDGRLEDALSIVESALAWSEAQTDLTLRDRVICSRARLLVELGTARSEDLTRLREILMMQRDSENCFLAAIAVSRAYEIAKESRKARFYAQIAHDRARELDDKHLSSSLNQLANVSIAESRFEEAAGLYREALALQPESAASRRAPILHNLGYAEIVLGLREIGFRHLHAGLRLALTLPSHRPAMLASLDLAFAHLQFGDARWARRHARRALGLARRYGIADAEKNALYLLGAACAELGDSFTARRWYRELQSGFYPDSDYLPDLLLTVDVRSLVNLKA